MKNFVIIFALVIMQALAFANDENTIFDNNRINAQQLLHREYQKSKVLFLGFAYHANHKHIDQLRELLKKNRNDQRLKVIILERAGDLSEFYQHLSRNDLKETLKVFKFKNEIAKKQSLCFGEWAYAIEKLLPDIREINKSRNTFNPLLVKTIDGMQSDMEETYPGLGKKMIDGSCKTSDVTVPPIYNVSTNRELNTAKNFYKDIWSKLGPNDKAIVLYNRGHLLPSFKACTPNMLSPELFESNVSNVAWIDDFYEIAPEAKGQSSLIVFDEKYNEVKDGTTFEFSRRQSSRYPGEDWAVPLQPFIDKLKETGLEMMTKSSDYRSRMNETATSDPLPEIAAGLIWNAKAHLLDNNLTGADYSSTKESCSGSY